MRRLLALSLIVATLAGACAGSVESTEPVVVEPKPVVADTTIPPALSASGSVVGSGSTALVTVAVTVRNPDVRARQFTFIAPCTVILKVYTTAARTDAPAFSSALLPGGCKASPWIFTLEAGGAKTFTEMLSAGTILVPPDIPVSLLPPGVRALPPGHYFFSALLVLREVSGGSVELPAGEGDLST